MITLPAVLSWITSKFYSRSSHRTLWRRCYRRQRRVRPIISISYLMTGGVELHFRHWMPWSPSDFKHTQPVVQVWGDCSALNWSAESTSHSAVGAAACGLLWRLSRWQAAGELHAMRVCARTRLPCGDNIRGCPEFNRPLKSMIISSHNMEVVHYSCGAHVFWCACYVTWFGRKNTLRPVRRLLGWQMSEQGL